MKLNNTFPAVSANKAIGYGEINRGFNISVRCY